MQATIVSLVPFLINEKKPGLYPPEYIIPPANGGFTTLIVQDGHRPVFLDGFRGSEYMHVSGEVIAKSVVEDFKSGQPAQDPIEAGPGIFFLNDKLNRQTIEKEHQKELIEAAKYQHTWWIRLLRLADDLWTANHKYAQISDLERVACRQLGVKRDWLDDSPESIQKCPVCTTLVSVHAIVCFACHVILNKEEYKKFEFANAGVQK